MITPERFNFHLLLSAAVHSAALLFLSFATLATTVAQQPSADETLNKSQAKIAPIIAVEYPPFVINSTPPGGIAFDYLHQAMENSSLVLTTTFLPSARATLTHLAKEDWLLSLFPPTELKPHIKKLRYNNNKIAYSLFRIRQPGEFSWKKIDELSGSSVAVIRSLEVDQEITQFRAAGLKPVLVNKIEQGLQMLLRERVDYLLAPKQTGEYYSKLLGVDPTKLQFADTIIHMLPYHVFLNLNHPLAQEVEQALLRSGKQNSDP